MITILAYDCTFGAAYNLRKAFSLQEETRLITLLEHERHPFDTDILLTEDTAAECRHLIEHSTFTVIADAAGLAKGMIQKIAPPNRKWQSWAGKQRWYPFWGDRAYYFDAIHYNTLASEVLKAKRVYAMMDLMYLAPKGTIPLCHPVVDPGWPIEKPKNFHIMHSPGTNKKRITKGTERVERIVKEFTEKYPRLVYGTIMGLPHHECIELKKLAHVFIDQVPDPGMPAGMGRSGEEAMASGSIVITSLFGVEYFKDYFETPPVIPAYNDESLRKALERVCLMSRDEVQSWSANSRAWAEKYLILPGWLEYFYQWK